MLSIDTKVLSKAISNKLKSILPTLISSQRTAYVKSRFIGESGRLISDIIETSGWFNITGFLVTMGVGTMPQFSHFWFGKVWFWKKSIAWIEILLKNQQLCVINGATTT